MTMPELRRIADLDDVKDPVVRSKLMGYQEVVFDTDEEIIATRAILAAHEAVVTTKDKFVDALKVQCTLIQNRIKADELTHAEGKLRMDQMKVALQALRDAAQESEEQAHLLRGKLVGLQAVVTKTAARFDTENEKYEVHQRIDAEDAEEKDTVVSKPRKPSKKKASKRKR
jgi:hypothetical protein